MKLLVVCSTLDMRYRLGGTPFYWQLLKALHEVGNEVIAVPYLGAPVETLWWRTYPNPCLKESQFVNFMLNTGLVKSVKNGRKRPGIDLSLVKYFIRPRWERHLLNILHREGNIEAVLFLGVTLNHFTGIPGKLKAGGRISVMYFDGDLPDILPPYYETSDFKFNHYQNADLGEFDAFLTPSEGIISRLKEMGSKNTVPFHYGVDPQLYSPVAVPKDIDIFFYAHSLKMREDRFEFMVSRPSTSLPEVSFLVGGKNLDIDAGKAKRVGVLPVAAWRTYCCRSRINLNITKRNTATVYASSSARPFELAALGCCVVSDPYDGLEKWFEPGKEIFLVSNEREAAEIYQTLLSSEELRQKTGEMARKRVLDEHTCQHRALEIMNIIRQERGNDRDSVRRTDQA